MSLTSYRAAPPRDPLRLHNAAGLPQRKRFREKKRSYCVRQLKPAYNSTHLMNRFIKGQRWMSESEPELGLATVIEAGLDRVQILFSATGETRTYASDNAPLKRVRFRAGDLAQTQAGKSFKIREVTEKDGLLKYAGEDGGEI